MLHQCFLFEFTLQIIHGLARIQKYLQFCLCLCHTRVGTFEVCVPTHVTFRVIMQPGPGQTMLQFLANKSAELAVPQFFGPENCIKRHVELLSGPSSYLLFRGVAVVFCVAGSN